VTLAACDTFRAAAVEQLKSWATKLDLEIIASEVLHQFALLVMNHGEHVDYPHARRKLCEQWYYRSREEKYFAAGK